MIFLPFRISPQSFMPPAKFRMQNAFGILGGILKTGVTKSLTKRLIRLFSAILAKNTTRMLNGNFSS
jgi:hypothetical protein